MKAITTYTVILLSISQYGGAQIQIDFERLTQGLQNLSRSLLEPLVCITDLAFDRNMVKYTLYRNQDRDVAHTLNYSYFGTDLIDNTVWTLLMVQGWLEDIRIEPWPVLQRDEYFKIGQYNVIFVDWSYFSQRGLITTNCAIVKVGVAVGDFLNRLIGANRLNHDLVQINGFSYGAQIAGFAGQIVYAESKRKIRRITGMDPGGPGFEILFQPVPPDMRLSFDDALEVTVIHSSTIIGMTKPIGHVDFFINGGKFQPFCKLLPLDMLGLDFIELVQYIFCSHIFSNIVKTLSIRERQLYGVKCASFEAYEAGICDYDDRLLLSDASAAVGQGSYYLNISLVP